jgi:glycosyltransferase involved in cell wall biosynthesis
MSPSLRILFATAEPHPCARPDVRVLFGQSLPALGVQVDLLALGQTLTDCATPPSWPGGVAFLRPARTRMQRLLGDLAQQLSLFRRCSQGYDALVVRDKPVLGVIGFAAARIARIRFCYWMSYPLPEQYLWLARRRDGSLGVARRVWLWLRGMAARLCLEHLLVPHADWLFVQSDAMAAALRRGPLRHDRVSAVPMGVDAAAMPPAAPALPHPLEDHPTAVYLGTLDRYRCPEIMVDAAERVGRVMPDFRLMIIGEADEPSDRGWLRRHAVETGAARWVHFTGRLPFDQALALAQCAQVGLSPVPRSPLTEVGSPTKAVEYLACGLPVICNDQPDQAWVIEQSGGGRVVALDAQAFADAIIATLSDPLAAQAQAEAGRRWVKAHRDYEVLARGVEACLRALASSPELSAEPSPEAPFEPPPEPAHHRGIGAPT